jgi:hypothetical protein
VQGSNDSVAADRAVWLAEIAATLAEATTVVGKISNSDRRIEVVQLYAAIEALKLEVESMRIRRAPRPWNQFDPNRLNLWSEPTVRTA